MNVNIKKSEICIFSKTAVNEQDKSLSTDDKNFPYNRTPKLLGVILDKQMKFEEHTDHVEGKAYTALRTIREIKGIAQISRPKLLQIYNS